MTTPGLTGLDMLERARVRMVRRNPNDPDLPPAVDPVRGALETRREMLASRILEADVKEAETKAIDAGTAFLRARIEKEKVERELKGGDEDQFRQWMMGQLEATQQRLAQAEQARQDEKAQALNERLVLLQNELAALRQASQQPAERPGALIREYLTEAKDVMALVAPPPGPPPILTPDQATLEVWREKNRLEHEARQWAREDQRAIEERRLAQEGDLALRKLTIEEHHYGQVDRFINDSGPRIIATLTQMAERWLGGANGAGGAPAPVVAGAAQPQAPAVPAGAQAMPCQGCGATLLYREGWPGVICPSCGTEHVWKDEAPEAPA